MFMITLKLSEILKNKQLQVETIRKINLGRIFIYPTDTVYGIGCDAGNRKAVGKIREIKGGEQPFSVIAPSKKWILENLEVGDKKFLDYLPGPYTLILKKKNPEFLSWISPSGSLGVRIPKHPLTGIIQKSGKPFVTTSANIHGSETIRSAENLPEKLKEADIVIDGGYLNNPPSAIIDLTKGKVKIKERK